MHLPRRSLLLALPALVACRPRAAAPARLTARRVVSLGPAATECLLALGAGDRVVGVSALCDAPEVSSLPRVGTMVSPDRAALRALRPDLVVGVAAPGDVSALAELRAQGVAMAFPTFDSLDELPTALAAWAGALGDRARAADLARRVDEARLRVERAVAGRPRPRVVAVLRQQPLVVAGAGSWTDAVLRAAGADNAVQNANRFPMVSPEQVAAASPDVLLDLTWRTDARPLADAWSAPPGAAPPRVVRLTETAVVRQGPRFAEGAAAVARALHPGVRV